MSHGRRRTTLSDLGDELAKFPPRLIAAKQAEQQEGRHERAGVGI